jgi:hypothetical protein
MGAVAGDGADYRFIGFRKRADHGRKRATAFHPKRMDGSRKALRGEGPAHPPRCRESPLKAKYAVEAVPFAGARGLASQQLATSISPR